VHEWIAGFAEHLHFNAQFFSGLWMIILIDIILSGDNSVVIAMAVQSLPEEKRRKGIIIGTAAAVLMRIGFTLIATTLMTTPIIKIVGGVAILWIAVKLLSENEEQVERHKKPAETITHAVRLILIADASMSIDNVMAVAGAAHGNLVLLWFGLMLSIPLVVFASSILSKLMSRFPWIVVIGALLLGKIGGEMIMTDHLLQQHVLPQAYHTLAKYIGESLGVLLVGSFAFYYWNRDRKVAPAQEPEFHTEERADGPT
jgi:YjbE family integral membrane protein